MLSILWAVVGFPIRCDLVGLITQLRLTPADVVICTTDGIKRPGASGIRRCGSVRSRSVASRPWNGFRRQPLGRRVGKMKGWGGMKTGLSSRFFFGYRCRAHTGGNWLPFSGNGYAAPPALHLFSCGIQQRCGQPQQGPCLVLFWHSVSLG